MGNNILHQHPGLRLKMELKNRKITQKDFAVSMGMQPSHLSEIIKGRRNITEQTALKLDELLNIPSAEWLRMQADYDYQVKMDSVEESADREADRQLTEYDAIYDMRTIYKYVGISKECAVKRLDFCKNILNFKTPAFQERTIQGYFHKSEKTGLDTRMIATWSVLAMYEAMQEPSPAGKFDKSSCDELAIKLSEIFNDNHNTINRVERIFNEYGIKFCIVPKVPHASIDGFSFYCNGVPCVVVTKRFNRIDNFAFAILHELGHLKMHLSQNGIGKVSLVNPDEEKLAKEEMEANHYAADALIPEEIWAQQPKVRLNPREIEIKFTRWAKQINKNKWIVLGRASHETNIYMFKSDPSREIQ